VSREYKGKAMASIHSFMYVYHFDIWLLVREPIPWGF
jgi:hypothetical protein